MTISTTDLGIPVGEDLDRIVEEQIRDIKVAGASYNFRPEAKCKVCRNDELRQRVEDLLSAGTTYREILAIIRPSNSLRARTDQITYNSIRRHSEECFDITRAAQVVYRRILERRAVQHNKDFVKGVGHAVTIQAVLETVMVKGYAAITDERIPITPELAISAGLKLYEMEDKDQGTASVAEMIAQVQRIQEVVLSLCTPEQIKAIDAALAAEQGVVDAEWSEEEDDDDEDNEFDPSTDVDEVVREDHEGF